MDKIGFIGLGRMGAAMASNLLRKGHALNVYDVNPAPVAALVSLGAHGAANIINLAQNSDIIFTILPSSVEVERVYLEDDGLFANAKRGSIFVDMTTGDPAITDALEQVACRQEKFMVDAPVGRLASHADRGESLFMVGATLEIFHKVLPLLQAMGSTIHHCGPVGTGIRTKLVNNYLAVVSCQMNAEALALSQRFGLDLTNTLEVLNGTTATNGQLKVAWPTKVLAGDLSPGFTIDLAHKDLSLILVAANAARVPMPLGAVAREMFTMARAGQYAKADFSAVVDVLCDFADIEKPRLPADKT